MAQTVIRLQTRLMKEYYKFFSKYAKGKLPENKVAWITAFTPVEILESLGITYYYPESYAAVIAASGQDQVALANSEDTYLTKDCCSYSCCIQGCLNIGDGPRGIPPKPDILIATNNQCNTLPNWWNTLAERYDVPLVIIDYPGESVPGESAYKYVKKQHEELISTLEQLTGNSFCEEKLNQYINNSRKSIDAWRDVVSSLKYKDISATSIFDDINFLITARCKAETSEMYSMMAEEYAEKPDADNKLLPLFWIGYPLWYHEDRYLSELLKGCRICGSNYVSWWCLDYSGKDIFERLFNAYNYTFLNLKQMTRNSKLQAIVHNSGAVGAIVLHNKSCKCDYVSARGLDLPQAEVEIDMIDGTFLDIEKAKKRIELLKEISCIA